MRKLFGAAVLAVVATLNPAWAANIAIFGDNDIDNYLVSVGNSVTLVTDVQLATAGFLNPFDLFIYTRDGGGFGDSLSEAAAVNVVTFATGNVVLFTSDLADVIQVDTNAQTLLNNAVNFTSKKGFIGEFTGACAAMTSNAESLTPLGLISGNCARLGSGPGGNPMVILQPNSPIVAGLTSPVDLGGGNVFFATLTGVDENLVVAKNTIDGEPGIPNIVVLQRNGQPVDEPGVLALLGCGLVALSLARRRRQVLRAA
jgi:hypothetical protein